MIAKEINTHPVAYDSELYYWSLIYNQKKLTPVSTLP